MLIALTGRQRMANLRARNKGLPEPYIKAPKKPYVNTWKPKHASREEFIFQDYYSPLNHNDWAEYYCGHSWNIEYLDRMTEKIWQYHRILVFLPRGHGKTLRVIALATRHILEQRTPLLILTSGPASKQRIFDTIRLILRSERITHDYGEMFISMDRNKCEIRLLDALRDETPDPILRVASRGADIIGSHPKWIHLEDIIQEEFKSDESNEGLQAWYKQVVSFCATHEVGKETRITATGTRKAKNDFYAFLIKELKYPEYTEKALVLLEGRYPTEEDITYLPEGKIKIDHTQGVYDYLECPSWPLSRLLVEKILKPLEFRTQMQNEPIDPFGNYFSLAMYNESPFTFDTDTQIIITIDPAFGRSAAADNTAIAVIGRNRTKPKAYVLLEIYAGKIKSLVHTLKHIYDKYADYTILRVVCEANYHQKIFIVDKLNQSSEIPFTVAPFINTGEKVLRIQSLHDPMISKQLTIWDECPGKAEFKEELLAWIPKPSTASRKDDRLDAVQMGLETWIRLSSGKKKRSGITSSQFSIEVT